jgi:branched-chain amino acid transport system permease protein
VAKANMDFINAIILLLNYIFVPALSYGSQLALGAIFVSLIYGILRFAYFSAGDLMSFGTMFTILFTWYFQSIGISLGVLPTALLAIPFAIIISILFTLGMDKVVFSYYRIKKSPPVMLAMVSIGVMFVTQAIVRIIIGPFDRRFFDGEKFILKANEFKEMTGLNEGLSIKSTQVLTLFVTIVVVSILFWFLNKTKTGKSMRAYSDNEDLALLSGIDPKKVVMITWIIAAVLATIGGALYGLDKSFKPFTYFNNMLPIFAAAIVGGIGNPFGAFLGGYVIAFSEILLTYAYRKFFVYILPESMEPEGLVQLLSTDYKFAVSFSILVIVLLFRPSGIFKGKVI